MRVPLGRLFSARVLLIVFQVLVTAHIALAQPVWTPQAPGPNTLGQVEGIEDGEVVGAIKAIAAHPKLANTVYVGAVNGGIWKTENAMAPRPKWVPQTDGQRSLSIGAIEFDPTDPSGQTLVAGHGRFSSLSAWGGVRAGLLRTTDGGAHWLPVDGASDLGLNVSGVAPRGLVIVAAANDADNLSRVGIWRSADGGKTWTQISGRPASGLPTGASADLAGDPADRERLFTVAAGKGIYASNDTGATWKKVSDASVDAMLVGANNVRIAVGMASNVYVAVAQAQELAAVFRSGDGGATWTAMDLPETVEGGAHPGRQAGIHLSIAADPGNPHVVYLGGDRQPLRYVNGQIVANSIGARDYSGRLFRGDASRPSGSQWVHLTHSRNLGAAGGGTASGSAPHADSRDMAIAADGVLIEADDGGVYRRTAPLSNTGDWFSMNGNLQATEFHSVAWDRNVDLVIGGAQDTGTPEQRLRADVTWRSVSTGDGGVVAVDDESVPGQSTRYSSYQELILFRREVYDSQNVLQSRDYPALAGPSGKREIAPLFYTPLRLNTVTGTRMVLGGANGLFESFDEGDTTTAITPEVVVNATGPQIIAYGAADNSDVLYVGSGANVYVRTTAPPAPLVRSVTYNGGRVVGIALNPARAKTAYVLDLERVFSTADYGKTWTNVTGNLQQLRPGALRSITCTTATPAGAVVVGSDRGVFEAPGPSFSAWRPLAMGHPGAPVYHLEYDPADEVLLAGTLGRGAWTLALGGVAPLGPPPGNAVQANGATKVLALEAEAAPEELPTIKPVEVLPGVIVDAGQKRAYVMAPGGSIEAVRLTDGQRLWVSGAAAKPLGIAAQRIVGQSESGGGNTLGLVTMNTATGQLMGRTEVQLPAGVTALVTENQKERFNATVLAEGGDALVFWTFEERPVRGLPPGTPDALPRTQAPPHGIQPDAPDSQGGAIRLNVLTGAAKVMAGPKFDMAMAIPPPPAVPEQTAAPSNRFASADNRHFIARELTSDGSFERYSFAVYERVGEKRVGAFRSHVARVPFVVTDSVLIYVTEPYARRVAGELIEEPRKVRALDLKTGTQIWTKELRETTPAAAPPP